MHGKRKKFGSQYLVGFAAAVTLALSGVAGTTAAHALAPDAYLDDYENTAGQIIPENGNFSGLSQGICGFSWSSQAVIDTDLTSYSTNGFLESVQPTGGVGSGYASLQHFYFVNTDTVNWRIPIAVDGPVINAQVHMVFDDPDWVVDTSSFWQYSDWTMQPGYESAFHRFTGITGFAPHDDSQVSPHVWGIDSNGYTTLSFGLGDIAPMTSTIFQISGTANSTPGFTGIENILNGVAYGAKFTLNGTQPMAECVNSNYPVSVVRTGESITVLPTHLDGDGNSLATLPAGTMFVLGSGAPAGMTINPATGEVQWTAPVNYPLGSFTVPIEAIYSDDTSTGIRDSLQATVYVLKEPHLGPFANQHITLGQAITSVHVETFDHNGLPYGEGSTLTVDNLPPGTTFDPVTGLISGTPTESGVWVVTVSAFDAGGEALLDVGDAPLVTTFTVTVVTSSVNPTPPVLANTGASFEITPWIAGALLLAGFGALWIRRTPIRNME